ncbi:MAG TPA: L,D-transpeptidase [Gemmatimonadaceae bacterium]|nr:L,D-transpeptidase [Gemmatimonadaceae bacterium]
MMNRSVNRSLAVLTVVAGAAGLAGMTYSTPAPTRVQAPAQLVADLSDKIIYVYEGDSVVSMYDIADGKDPYPTPRGSFKIRKLNWNPSWTPPDSKWARNKRATEPGDPKNPMKVVKIFFKEPDYYIHGTADIESLGSAQSHGCLRMHPDDVMKLGMWVMAHGGQPREENWFWRLIHSRNEEKVIYLTNPVPIVVQD